MGLETVSYLDDLVVTNPTTGDPRSEGDDHFRNIKTALKATFPGMVGRSFRFQTKSSNYTVLTTDNLSVINCTAAITLALTAAATLGSGHFFIVYGNSDAVTIDPNGAETINGLDTLVVGLKNIAFVFCNGSNFFCIQVPQGDSSILTPSQITSNQSNYNPTGAAGSNIWRISSDASRTIRGITSSNSSGGRVITLCNVGAFPIILSFEDGTATAANRFNFGKELSAGQAVRVIYDATLARWMLAGSQDGVGTIKEFAGVIEEGYLTCDGSAVSRTTYAGLFNKIGTVWGTGNGSTTFNVPDFMGRVRLGAGTGSVVESGVNADVSTGSDTLTVASNTRKWITGMSVVFTLSSGTITGLTSGNTYYVIRNSATTVKLASSLANAQNGTAIDLTAKSTPVWTITHALEARTLGDQGGEQDHAMSSSELLAHTHTVTAAADSTAFAGGSNSADDSPGASTGSTGGNAAMNNMQPYATVVVGIKF